ncbi:hypothetical protein [Haloarchaeobius sp. DYHT-AS-18]|uniref:hypothetical protein n=1 Tax=Haloarchaeobius sp. DYHT-AS-18 TaxID=3446117 RepID=UPI003EBF3C6C
MTTLKTTDEHRLTGVTVVDDVVTYSDLRNHSDVTPEWFRRYTNSVLHESHLIDDLNNALENGRDPVSAHRRLAKIILGDPVQSFWVGSNGPVLEEALFDADIQIDTSSRTIHDLEKNEGKRLYEILSSYEKMDGKPDTVLSTSETGCRPRLGSDNEKDDNCGGC